MKAKDRTTTAHGFNYLVLPSELHARAAITESLRRSRNPASDRVGENEIRAAIREVGRRRNYQL